MIKLNGVAVPTTHFPDNTSQVWKLDPELLRPYTFADVTWEFSHEGEFLHLAQLKALLDASRVRARLRITYLPYGRQDKPVDNLQTFALVPFARLLNALGFSEVTIVDPHSEVALELIHNSSPEFLQGRLDEVMCYCHTDLVCYPDKGALSKYSKAYSTWHVPYIHGEKVRDPLTGNITSYEIVEGPWPVDGKNVLIVDDICDGGATFRILAKDLLAKGAKSVALFVAHGIFSKGTRCLFEAGISRVFTAAREVGPREGSQNV